MSTKPTKKSLSIAFLIFGSLIVLWGAAAFIGALHQANWQIGTLARHYMIATGMVKPLHTLVDFYSHIKGIEYLICVAFFVAFTYFFKYVHHEAPRKSVTVRRVR